MQFTMMTKLFQVIQKQKIIEINGGERETEQTKKSKFQK